VGICSTLESGLDKHCNNSALSPTYNPELLARTSKLSADISHLLELPDDNSSWKSHDIHNELLLSTPDALKTYTARITTLSSHEPARLLAHSYVRYLGDLSGGQIMRWKLRKTYKLDNDEGHGLKFYEFAPLVDEGGEVRKGDIATAEEMKKIKEWFRTGIDKGVGDDRELKGAYFPSFRTFLQL
jgi:heme oxygenase (biliverdin-producing, ferredoxin)